MRRNLNMQGHLASPGRAPAANRTTARIALLAVSLSCASAGPASVAPPAPALLTGAHPAAAPAFTRASDDASGAHATAGPVLEALAPELERGMRELGRQDPAPYFLGYEVSDRTDLSVRASDGIIEGSTLRRRRVLDVDMRVGSSKFDSHRSHLGVRPPGTTSEELPIEDDAAALRAETWSATLSGYRQAAARFAELKSRG
jgi:hypothetical protein